MKPIIGSVIGAFVGFLLRPSAMLVGQLPFGVVITRGAYLKDLEQLLVPTAQTSFNIMVAGAILGALAGMALRHLASRKFEGQTIYHWRRDEGLVVGEKK